MTRYKDLTPELKADRIILWIIIAMLVMVATHHSQARAQNASAEGAVADPTSPTPQQIVENRERFTRCVTGKRRCIGGFIRRAGSGTHLILNCASRCGMLQTSFAELRKEFNQNQLIFAKSVELLVPADDPPRVKEAVGMAYLQQFEDGSKVKK